ncbi:MAG: hypothetical protein NTV79_01235 [Candidatus Aureabacteria bacterium]|nr:hypothetical protein [Candidatus Auribacterota bacterium]
MKENLKGEWMNRMLVIISVIMLAVPPAVAAAPSGADSLDVVIVFPGAPDLEKEAGKFVVQLTALIAREAGVDPSALHGHFFGSAPSALEYLGSHRDSFIIASLGFFLSHRDSLKLQPLASVEMTAGPNDRYFLVIRKGKYASLDDLKGKTLAGNTLYEDPAFLSKIVFDGKIDVSSYFILKATPRPLSALRQLIEDKLDAVLLDQVQYESLKTLAIFSRIETIFTSPACRRKVSPG